MRDLSSPTRDGTHAPCSGNAETAREFRLQFLETFHLFIWLRSKHTWYKDPKRRKDYPFKSEFSFPSLGLTYLVLFPRDNHCQQSRSIFVIHRSYCLQIRLLPKMYYNPKSTLTEVSRTYAKWQKNLSNSLWGSAFLFQLSCCKQVSF